MRCEICNSVIRSSKTIDSVKFYNCKKCDFRQIDYSDSSKIYSISEKNKLAPMTKTSKVLLKRASICNDYMSGKSKILDLGSGCARFACAIRDLKLDDKLEVISVDFSDETSKYSKLPVLIGDISSKDLLNMFELKSFDMITSFHSLEHIVHPKSSLENWKQLLKDGGLIVIEVPCVEEVNQLPKDGHISFFTKKSIRSILQSVGFEILECFVDEKGTKTSPTVLIVGRKV